MLKVISLFVCFNILSNHTQSQNRYPIIPYPNKLVEVDGEFEFKTNLTIDIPDAFKIEMETVGSIFKEEYYTNLIPSKSGKLVVRQNNLLRKEAYKLSVTKDKILVEASGSNSPATLTNSCKLSILDSFSGVFSSYSSFKYPLRSITSEINSLKL